MNKKQKTSSLELQKANKTWQNFTKASLYVAILSSIILFLLAFALV